MPAIDLSLGTECWLVIVTLSSQFGTVCIVDWHVRFAQLAVTEGTPDFAPWLASGRGGQCGKDRERGTRGGERASEEKENATSAPESDSHVRTYTPRSCHHRPHFHTPGSWTHTHLPRTYTAALAGASRGAGPHITGSQPGPRVSGRAPARKRSRA